MTQLISYESSSFNKNENLLFNILYAIVLIYTCYIFIIEKEKYNLKFIDLKQNIIIEKEKREKLEQKLTEQFISEKEKYNKIIIDLKQNIIIEKEKREKLEQKLTQQFILEKENINFKINDFKKNIKRTLTDLTQQFISEKEKNESKIINFKEELQHQLSDLTQQFILEKEKNVINEEQNDTILIGYIAVYYNITIGIKIPLYYDKNINDRDFIESMSELYNVYKIDYTHIIIIDIENLYKLKNLQQNNIEGTSLTLYCSNIVHSLIRYQGNNHSQGRGRTAFVLRYHGNNVLSSIEYPMCKSTRGFINLLDKQIFKTSYINLLNTHPTLFRHTKCVDDYLKNTQFH